MSAMNEVVASCRICAGRCALKLTLDDDGRIIAAHGDRSNPLTRGYACIKGLKLHEAHYSPDRLHHPLRRRPDGGFEEISLERALDEIAERLDSLVAESGPNAVAAFKGTMNYTNFLANAMLPAFLQALGSTAFYSTMTIDQSAKWVTFERLGGWAAGKDPFEVADVLLMVGTNPLVSLATFNFPLQNPVKQMREARERGLKLVVIDPRETETARHADVFLQILPGEDPAVLAGLIRIILERGWHDAAFCAAHVNGFEVLRKVVEPFTPDDVAKRAGISADALFRAAALFAEPARDGDGLRRKRGSGASGTGPNMAVHSNLSEHLLECLNVLCGRFARPGDRVMNPGVLGPRRARRAEVIPPGRSWEDSTPRSPGGYGMLFGERMSGALVDDILADSPDRVRALIVDGGNPAIALPDGRRAAEGLRALDLLVTIDPFLTPTARLSHYVIPPKMMFERADVGSRDYETIVTFAPYGQYDMPIMALPEGSEATEDWVILWEIVRRMGRTVSLDGVPFDMNARPASEELIGFLLRDSAVPLDELRRHARGHIFDIEPMTVEPGDPASTARFELAPADIVEEMEKVLDEVCDLNGGFTHRLCVRRIRDVQNTMYHRLPSIHARVPENPASLHPDDMASLSIGEGEQITMASRHGQIACTARADATMRSGVVSMTHGWGALAGETGPEPGVNVNALTSGREDRDPINAMPRFTGFPVRIEHLER